MKKIIIAVVAFVAISTGVSAQRNTIAPMVTFMSDPGSVGIGARFTHSWDNWRFAPDVAFCFPSNAFEFDINLNAHYTFNVAPDTKVYPLAGIWMGMFSWSTKSTFGTLSGSNFYAGFNLGVGGEYDFTDRWSGFLELKGILRSGSRFGCNIGAAYRF